MATPSYFLSDSADIECEPFYPGIFIPSPRDSISLQDNTSSSKCNVNKPATYCEPSLLRVVDTSALAEPPSTIPVASNSRSSTARSSRNSVRPNIPNSTGTSPSLSTATKHPRKQRGQKANVAADEAEGGEKRSTFLKKNRMAASKCRQKKKEYISDLEETKLGLEQQNSYLQREFYGLLEVVYQMKNKLISHTGCKDPNIDRWVQNEARKFVEGAQSSGASQTAPVDGSLHTRRFSAPAFPLSGLERSSRYISTSSRQDSLACSVGKPFSRTDCNILRSDC